MTEIDSGSATISYQLKAPGRAAKGVVWYGELDAITFAPRKLHGTERGRASEKLFGKGQSVGRFDRCPSPCDGWQSFSAQEFEARHEVLLSHARRESGGEVLGRTIRILQGPGR